MTNSPPGGHDEASVLAEMDKWILDLMTIRDADFFSDHPDTSEFYRRPYPIEIELLFPDQRDLPYEEFRVVVTRVNDDTFLRRLLRRHLDLTYLVGLGVSTYPTNGVAKLQSHRCGGVCCK